MTYNPNQPIRTATPQPPTTGHHLSYDDLAWMLTKIAFSNALLLIPTLGFYRFWAKTKLRRHFWSSVKLDGEALEYTGTAKELLIGFLIALAIFLPIIIVMQVLQFLASSDPDRYLTLAAIVNSISIITLLFLIYVAFFTARRYRMSRTLWRGIRGGLDGSAAVYALRCFGAAFLSAITLGIATPYADMFSTRYIINNSRFGSQQFAAPNLTAGPLMKRWLRVLLGFYIFIGVMVTLGVIDGLGAHTGEPPEPSALFGFAVFAGILGLMLLNFWYAVFRIRYIISQITYGPVRFASGITTKSVMWIGFLYLVSFIGLIIALALLGSLFLGGLAVTIGPSSEAIPILAILFIGGLALMGSSILIPLMLVRPLLKRFIQTLVIAGKIDFTQVAQTTRGPKRGEGLADILDIGGL
jgi:uncharacterized membrane protein YjgN (DUF898 family)